MQGESSPSQELLPPWLNPKPREESGSPHPRPPPRPPPVGAAPATSSQPRSSSFFLLDFGAFPTQLGPVGHLLWGGWWDRRGRRWRQRVPLTAVSGLHPPNSPSLKPEVLPHTSSVPLVANPVSLEKLQEKENCCGKRGKNVVCPPPILGGQRAAAPAEQSPDGRQMSPKEPPLLNHDREGPGPQAGSTGDIWGHPSSGHPRQSASGPKGGEGGVCGIACPRGGVWSLFRHHWGMEGLILAHGSRSGRDLSPQSLTRPVQLTEPARNWSETGTGQTQWGKVGGLAGSAPSG